jgi:hypothetical protein
VRFQILFLILMLNASLAAREPYHAKVTVDGVSGTVSDPNLLDLSRSLKTTSLELLIPLYTPTSPVSIAIDLRGINVITSFAANSTTLQVDIPQAHISQSFTGATRDESIKLFKSFIQDGGSRHRLLKAYQRYSPIDPIAGNPNSLIAQMAQNDYLMGSLHPLEGTNCAFRTQPTEHQFQIGASFARGFSKGFDTTAASLPIRYSYAPNLDYALIIDVPLTYLRNGGASSLTGSFGVGFQMPFTQHWSLTPIVRMGFGGSLDLCTSGNFLSTGLTSVYTLPVGSFAVSMTNYAGYLTSTNLWLTGVNFNYRLQSWVFKNGLSLTTTEGYCVYNRPLYFNVFAIDTAFTKNHLYMNHYDEVGVGVIATGVNPCLDADALTLQMSYLFGEQHFKGGSFRITYSF